jgi:nicotinamidase-related amidase
MCFDPQRCLVLVVDVQEALLSSIFEIDRVVARASFLIQIANLLEVPVLATEQNPSKMGGTEPSLAALLPQPFPKMAFSACGSPEAMTALEATGRRQIIVVGIETHICVSQTAHDLLDRGYEVAVCPDAVSARSIERHKLGMERIRDAGAVPAHTEAVAYEWLRSADHPKFRDALKIVKSLATN